MTSPLALLASRADPTRTTGVVLSYQRELSRRWRLVAQAVVRAVDEDDVLGLGSAVLLQIRRPSRFDFPSDPEGKLAAFDRWLREAMDTEVLEPRGWQNSYARAGYTRGVEHADRALRRAGVPPSDAGAAASATFNQPIHRDKLRLLFSRNFTELRGITEATAQTTSRVLTQSLATGASPRVAARELSQAVSSIGRARSLLLARTETVRAHAEATLARYEQAGVQGVSALAEFITARDDRVCQTCQDLEGEVFTIDQANGIIPVHPNCRCAWLPVL